MRALLFLDICWKDWRITAVGNRMRWDLIQLNTLYIRINGILFAFYDPTR